MAAKVYGYAESEADVDALRAYAVMDIILEDIHGGAWPVSNPAEVYTGRRYAYRGALVSPR